MQPWPALEPFARTVRLARSRLDLFVYESRREADTLVLLHGIGDEADTWRHLFIPLSERFHLVAPDLPGFGRSAKPVRAYTLPFFHETIIELLDTLEIPRAILVGHSLGAMLAQYTGLENPERVAELGLIGGSLPVGAQRLQPATLLYLIPGLGKWLYNRLRKDPHRAYASLRPYYHDLDSLPEADREFLFERVNQRVESDAQRDAFLSTIRSLAFWIARNQRETPAHLSKMRVPTLVIWGEADQMNDPAMGARLAEIQPGVRLVQIPDAGHNVQQEKPQTVLAALNAHLGQPSIGGDDQEFRVLSSSF